MGGRHLLSVVGPGVVCNAPAFRGLALPPTPSGLPWGSPKASAWAASAGLLREAARRRTPDIARRSDAPHERSAGST